MSVCLNMIVKNESHIILRFLESVVDIIDYYVICDTGSIDNTVQIIQEFFRSKEINGQLLRQEFVNFEFNRNLALRAAAASPAEYILLLDADMKLVNYSFQKATLTEDFYFVSQGNGDLQYQNVRIIRNDGRYKYRGVTHEFIETPPCASSLRISRDVMHICDIGDGGSKENKFKRDIDLLEKSLETDPDNCRTYFYLGNSYKNLNQPLKALKCYKKRIELGGWVEEVYMSYFELGHCYKALGNESEMISAWLSGHQVQPQRIETLYELCRHFRNKSKHHLAEFMYERAAEIMSCNKKLKVNMDEFLFWNPQIYNYLFEVERMVFSFYVNRSARIDAALWKVLACGDETSVANVLSNFKHYKFIPKSDKEIDLSCCHDDLISSSISIIRNGAGYIANQRFVNYHICKNGNYVSHFDKQSVCKNIKTVNQIIVLNSKFEIEKKKLYDEHADDDDCLYIGIEDVKIFNHNNQIYFLGTRYRKDYRLGMSFGKYEEKKLDGDDIVPEWNTTFQCEKNWVLATDADDELVTIYKWHPLIIGTISDGYLRKKRESATPDFMQHARGSSCGSKFEGNWYFMVHFVSYEAPRHYYHAIVTLDANLNFEKITRLFTFEGEAIEFSISLIADKEHFTIGYSTWDRTSKIRIYRRDAFD